MTNSSENMVPWDLISASLQNQITPEEEMQLQQWISEDERNKELLNWLKQTWETKLDDYKIYKNANETTAWNILLSRLENRAAERREGNVVAGDFSRKNFSIKRLASVAAVLVIVIGSFFTWHLNQSRNDIYQTGVGEQRVVLLPDSSSLKLMESTRIEIRKEYGKLSRETELITGKVFFEVKHDQKIPFIVNLGSTSVKDIGTSFLVEKQNDSIFLSVTNGKVAFINNLNQEAKELSAGMSLKFITGKKSFDPVITTDTVATEQNMLRFDNTALQDVILKLEKVYKIKIILTDDDLLRKRLTANLEGQSFESAISIVCQSLNIKYFEKNRIYYLENE